jgi:hypothetical protein
MKKKITERKQRFHDWMKQMYDDAYPFLKHIGVAS